MELERKWVICPNCTHKLFRLEEVRPDSKANIQVKCSSCKKIIRVIVDGCFDWEVEES